MVTSTVDTTVTTTTPFSALPPLPPSPPTPPPQIILTKPGYYTIPPLIELQRGLIDNGSCIVDGLVIGRDDYGEILFPGTTDIQGLNLDELGKSIM